MKSTTKNTVTYIGCERVKKFELIAGCYFVVEKGLFTILETVSCTDIGFLNVVTDFYDKTGNLINKILLLCYEHKITKVVAKRNFSRQRLTADVLETTFLKKKKTHIEVRQKGS